MSEKPSGKIRHHPPPISLVTRAGRSCSMNNGLEHEPKLQAVRIHERRSSIVSDDSDQKQHARVVRLVERFEKSQSTENLHHSQASLSTSTDGKCERFRTVVG